MSAAKLLADFHAQGVGVRLDGGSVQVTAPKGAVTDAQAATLRRCKAEIVRLLSDAANDQAMFDERAAFLEYCCDMSRADAERTAREQMLKETTPPAAGYAGFDWGDDPFKWFRQCPDLLRSAGGAA